MIQQKLTDFFFFLQLFSTLASKPRYVRVNTNLLSMEEADVMLAKEEWRKKDHPPFENYDDFLKAIQELEEDEYMLDMHVDNLLIFHAKQKQYWARHQFVQEKKFMLQDKVRWHFIQNFESPLKKK